MTAAHKEKAEIPAANEPPRDRAASSQITADLLSVIPNLRAFAVLYAAISIAPTISSRKPW